MLLDESLRGQQDLGDCLLSGVRSKQAYKFLWWLLPEFACAFAVGFRFSAVRENTQGFILFSLTGQATVLSRVTVLSR